MWTEERPLLARAASGYFQNQIRYHPFHAPSFYKSRRGLVRALHGLYQERGKTSSPSFYAFLRAASFASDTTSTIIVMTISNTMRLHEQDPNDKTELWSGRNEQRQQRLIRSVENILTLTALSYNIGPVTGQKVVPTTRVLQKHTNRDSALADDADSATGSFHEE